MAMCSVDGCESKSRANGLCNKHLMRWRLTGTTNAGGKGHAPIQERLGRHFVKGPVDECWLWKSTTNKHGYGLIAVGGKGEGQLLAHRVAWEIANGPIPKGTWVVMHTCDTPTCVNPAHLKLGTQSDNLLDMRAKRRGHDGFAVDPIRGEAHHDARFTEDDVRAIRASSESSTVIAERYGVHRTSIIKIRSRKTWKHVT